MEGHSVVASLYSASRYWRLPIFVAAVMLLVSWTALGQTVVLFPDTRLEAAVRLGLSKPVGDITRADLQALSYLYVEREGITNLSGLEWAVNLTSVGLDGNPIRDFAPLAGLTNLQSLSLGANSLTNLSFLQGLTRLNHTSFNRCRLT